MKIKNLLKYNLKSFLSFELIYKLLTTLIFVPLFLTCFKFITKITGYSYLTLENVISFLFNPLTIIFLIILLLIMTFYIILDISTVIIILDCSYQKKKIGVKDAFIMALKKAQALFHKNNFLICFLVLFLIPFLHLGLSSGFITTISIPEFILDFIIKNKVLTIAYVILNIILLIMLFRWLYALHYFILENCNFKEARQKSVNLSRKTKLKDFLSIVLTEAILGLGYIIFIFLGIILIIGIYKLIGKIKIISSLSITLIWLLIAISYLLVSLLITPISYGLISILYYKRKEEKKEPIKHITVSNKEKIKINKFLGKVKWAVIILGIFSSTLFTYSILNGKYDLKIEYIRNIEVTAHRGASVLYPENTMSAFKGAKEEQADWIELDVQQTKDHQIIVLHDSNLKRTTGVNKNTWDVTYDEIASLDAGSFFSQEYAFERIPLLEEVIKYAKENNLKLNIELKPTGREENFEKEVIDLIKKYDFTNNCVVTSQVYEVLENVKKNDKNIKTIYVMSLAYGNITNLKDADGFSIEASSINKKLVSQVHNEGKEVYAWTINTEENIQKMIDLKVDNIITDNIALAKDVIYKSKTSNLINEYVKFINNLLV